MKRLNEKQWRDETDRKSALLLKAVDTEVSAAEEERVLNFRISTETVDSYGDVIKSDGWVLERFLKNPVVLWAHSHYQPPVGKALSVGVEDNALVASAEFADAETYAFADTVYRLLKQGFLRATSVGFFPKEWSEVKDDERWGYDFTKQELYEFSVVPVPANPDALTLAADAGIDCTPLKEWAEKTLDMWKSKDEKTEIWLPKSQIEEIRKTLSGGPITSVTVSKTNTIGDLGVTQSALFESSGGTAVQQISKEAIAGTSPEIGNDITKTTTTTTTTTGYQPSIGPSSTGDVVITDRSGDNTADFKLFGETPLQAAKKELAEPPGDVEGKKALGTIKIEVDAEALKSITDSIAVLSDEVESLKAENDQLRTILAEKNEPVEEIEEKGELFDVIDIQEIDSSEVENEVDLAILDLDLDPEALQAAIRRHVEQGLMSVTGKLPKEV